MRMNSLYKRVVSLMVSAVLVFTTAFCVSVMPANAATTSLVANYFVSDATTNEIGTGNLQPNGNIPEWSTEENAVHFNADNNKQNYLKVKFSDIIPDPQYVDGITISFMAKDTAKYDSWQRYFEITTCNPYSGGDGSYLYTAVNGNVRIKNLNFNNNETDALSIGNADNEWHRYTIVIDTCFLYVYKDGKQSGYISNINIINQSLYNEFVRNGYIVFGASSYNDDAYTGYMKDVRIYNHSITEYEERNQDAIINSVSIYDLKNAVVDFENKMKLNYWYTNTKKAYDSYVLANRYLDAVNYGGATVDKIKLYSATSQLVNNMKLMKKWEKVSYTPALSSFKDDSDNGMGYSYANACTNLLRVSSVDYDSYTLWGEEQGVYVGSNKNTVQPAIFRPSAVMVYDGTDPSIPVMFLERLWKGGAFGGQLNMWTFYACVTGKSQGMYLNENWRGTEGNLNYLKCYFGKTASDLNYQYNDVDSFYKISRGSSKGEYKYYFANRLFFDGDSFESGEYVRTVKGLTWGFLFTNNDDPYYDEGDSHSKNFVGSEGDKNGINKNEVENPLYVINYKAVLDTMANFKAPLLNVENYKEGGLSNVLEKYDALADFNFVTEYDWDNNVDQTATACNDKMRSLISDLRSAQPQRSTAYSNLRSKLSAYSTTFNDYDLKNKYSESSANAFITAYQNGQLKMADLVNNSYSTNDDEINALVTNIENAYKGLKKGFIITFADIDGTELKTLNLDEGTTADAVLALAPEKPADGIYGDYIYTYSWGDITAVTSSATYTLIETQGEDVSAYNIAVAIANDCLADTEKYPQEDRDNLLTVLQSNVVTVSSTREEIDAYTSAITTATNQLGRKKINITYQLQLDGEVVSTEELTYRFEDLFSAVIPSKTNVFKWVSIVGDKYSVIARDTDDISYSVTEDATIIAYAVTDEDELSQMTKVTLLDNSNKVVSSVYVAVGTELEITDNGYIISDTSVTARAIPFYNIAGFEIGDTVYTSGSKIAVQNEDITIHTCYSVK